MDLVRLGLRNIAAASAALATGLLACFVDVDETLIDKAAQRDAQSEASADGSPANGDAAVDAGADADVYQGLACGKTFCRPPGQVCCATKFGDPDIANGICSTKDLCESGDYFGCESARDCEKSGLGNLLCCAVHDRGAFNLTKCAATCDATSSILCDPNAAVPCATGQRCTPSTEFPSLYECVTP